MSRTAIVIVAAALAFAAVTGTIALTKTVRLGRSATNSSISSHVIAKRTAQLDAFENSLHAQLKRKPPTVPRLPRRAGSRDAGRSATCRLRPAGADRRPHAPCRRRARGIGARGRWR